MIAADPVSHEPPPATLPGGGVASAGVAEEAPLEWTVNPWRRTPVRALGGVTATVGLWGVVAVSGGGLLTALVLGLAATAAIAPAFLPGRFRVDAAGVARRVGPVWDRRPWASLRRARVGEAGVLVSPLARPSFRDAFRAVALPVPAGQPGRDTLMAELRRRLERHGL